MQNTKSRFLFEQLDLRGELVELDSVLGEINAIHAYPAGVSQLLGEFVAASVLIASTLKFRGSLTVQARSKAQIPLIMAECSNELQVRAIARGAQEATATDFQQLLGGGQLVLTVTPERGNRYQGIVPLSASSLAHSIDHYFSQSEQLQSQLYLASDGSKACGMLLQQLPAQLETDPKRRADDWERITALAGTLTSDELLSIDKPTLLHRLFHEESVRLFEPQSVEFRCSCSQDRTLAALATVGEAEIRDILKEQGTVTMDCEFCNQRYRFREEELRGLLSTAGEQPLH
ncbi:MAG: Hsp33 family molecular chaperone HslO [Congregibacter sp.]